MRTVFNNILTVSLLLTIGSAKAILVGQVDTFDSDIQSWGGTASPTHVSTGGPAGSGDGFFQISRGSFHLATVNKAQWTGDYAAIGITSIEMDLNYISGPDAVNLRLLLWGDGGHWASTALTPVAPGWNHYSFGLTATDMVFVNSATNTGAGVSGGSGVLADTLLNVTALQIRHDDVTPTLPGNHPPHISATLGIDNIAAIPEPGTLGYVLAAGFSLYLLRKLR